MNNESIKSALGKLYECETDFTVIMTGKKSSRVNGFYKPFTHEIFLHNKNFRTDNELMYTAVHEFTHHVLTTEKGVRTAKCHTGIFWATFYDFLDKAIELGFYTRTRSEETQNLIETARKLQQEIIETQKRLGDVISKLYAVCWANGDRIEDVIEHDLQTTRGKANELMKMSGDTSSNNDEMAKVINSAKDEMVRCMAQRAADSGKTVEQVKAISRKKAKATDDDLESPEQLRREEKRLERAIERLNDRLVQVQETLLNMGGCE